MGCRRKNIPSEARVECQIASEGFIILNLFLLSLAKDGRTWKHDKFKIEGWFSISIVFVLRLMFYSIANTR